MFAIFAALLTVLFIYLKLTTVIAWSWFWVVSPLWITVLSFIVTFLVMFAIYIGAEAYNGKRK